MSTSSLSCHNQYQTTCNTVANPRVQAARTTTAGPSVYLIAITNRLLCAEKLPLRIAALCHAGFDYIIVREKDLSLPEYATVLREIACVVPARFWSRLILHTYTPSEISAYSGALKTFLSHTAGFHMSADQLIHTSNPYIEHDGSYSFFGASIHSDQEVYHALAQGVSYVIASHLYPTACKPNLAPRGIEFLDHVAHCVNTSTPAPQIWALGGITPDRAQSVVAHGAQGLCVMSSAMTQDPHALACAFHTSLTTH